MVGLSKETSKIVDLFWNEAQGNLSDLLKDPIESFTMETVNKAVAILIQLKDCLEINNGDEVTRLTNDFYEMIKHKSENRSAMDNIKVISQKLDLCQVQLIFKICNSSEIFVN